MFYKLYRVFLVTGLLSNAGALLLRQFTAAPDFGIGFLEGASIAMLLGSLYFLRRARRAGEAEAAECRCRRHGQGHTGKGEKDA